MNLLHRLIEDQVRRTPESPAVAFEGQTLTYGELNRRADALAARLVDLGVGPDALVALLLPRSLETIVGIVGILKAGGAYLPIDAGHPAARINFVLEDARPVVLLTESTLLDALPHTVPSTLFLYTFDWRRSHGTTEASRVAQANLAYLLYMNDLKGQPKGVCI